MHREQPATGALALQKSMADLLAPSFVPAAAPAMTITADRTTVGDPVTFTPSPTPAALTQPVAQRRTGFRPLTAAISGTGPDNDVASPPATRTARSTDPSGRPRMTVTDDGDPPASLARSSSGSVPAGQAAAFRITATALAELPPNPGAGPIADTDSPMSVSVPAPVPTVTIPAGSGLTRINTRDDSVDQTNHPIPAQPFAAPHNPYTPAGDQRVTVGDDALNGFRTVRTAPDPQYQEEAHLPPPAPGAGPEPPMGYPG